MEYLDTVSAFFDIIREFNNGSGNVAKQSRAIAVHVRYKFLYISLPSSAEQQRETLSGERELRGLTFLNFYFKFIAVSLIQFSDTFESDKQR